MVSISKKEAAIKIQRFWQRHRGHTNLSGKHGYDYYLSLLKHSVPEDSFTKLAKMMYGRVVATPNCGFPFLQQPNPYVGEEPCYHRNDILGSPLTSIILRQWGVRENEFYIYIPVVNTKLGTINDALRALNWTKGEYQLIEPPKGIINNHHLKFIKIEKNLLSSWEDRTFTTVNRWGKVSSLGIIASLWVLSKCAVDSGYIPETYDEQESTPNLIKQSLERQPKTITQLKKSGLLKKLHALKEKSTSDASLFARGLCALIDDLPSTIEAPDIIARLSFFIDIALLMHHDDHSRLADLGAAIIHEVSLLVLKHIEAQKKPLIDIEQYQSITATEMAQWINIDDSDYQFIALPAHSGSHANFIASQLTQIIGPKENGEPLTVRRIGGEYWEMMNETRKYTLFGTLVSDRNASIVRLSAGPIGDYQAGTYPAIDINKVIRQEAATNDLLQTLVIDTTSASYRHLKLEPDVLKIIEERRISLVFWESSQKLGLLHSDQAQYGRVYAYCHKTKVKPSQMLSLRKKAASDMEVPDAQIGAYIAKNCYTIMQNIRERHFKNGSILRQILAEDGYNGVNQFHSYGLSVDRQQDPFFFNRNNFSKAEIAKFKQFFKLTQRERASFGHRYTVQEGGNRISAGAEHPITATVFALSLRYYVLLSAEQIYLTLVKRTKDLDIFNKDELVNYLSLLNAWRVCPGQQNSITPMIAKRLSSIFANSELLKQKTLDGYDSFLTDVYAVLKSKSPFKAMIQEAQDKKNPFAITLFMEFNTTYTKTGRIDINTAIKKAIRITESIPFEQNIDEKIILKHKQKLISGEYSNSAKEFFKNNDCVSNSNSNSSASNAPMSIGMHILCGFIAVVGIAAVATAFTLLNAATFGAAGLVVAGLGVAAMLTGVGLFAFNAYKNKQPNDAPLTSMNLAPT